MIKILLAEAKKAEALSRESLDHIEKCASFCDNRGHILCMWRTKSHFMEGVFDFDMAPELTMSLHVGDADGPTVPCHFSTPEHPLNPDCAPRGAWCLIPKRRLAPGTLYTVVAENVPTGVDTSDKMEWSFRTGK